MSTARPGTPVPAADVPPPTDRGGDQYHPPLREGTGTTPQGVFLSITLGHTGRGGQEGRGQDGSEDGVAGTSVNDSKRKTWGLCERCTGTGGRACRSRRCQNPRQDGGEEGGFQASREDGEHEKVKEKYSQLAVRNEQLEVILEFSESHGCRPVGSGETGEQHSSSIPRADTDAAHTWPGRRGIWIPPISAMLTAHPQFTSCSCWAALTLAETSPASVGSGRHPAACQPGSLSSPGGQEKANLKPAFVIGQHWDTPGLSSLRVGQRRWVAGPAFVFSHLHADRCQQSNKFRVYGHKRQRFTCKYVCWATEGRGLKETTLGLRTHFPTERSTGSMV